MDEHEDEMPESQDSGTALTYTPSQNNPKAPAAIARACDYCRQRKAGCSREKPQCRNCKNAKRQCTYTDPVLRKENPTIKLSSQLTSLGTRLSRIEALLPISKQSSPSYSSSSDGDDVVRRLNAMDNRMNAMDQKLDSIVSLLSTYTGTRNRKENSPDLEARLESQKRRDFGNPSSDNEEDNQQIEVQAGEKLIADEKGNVYFLGRSSNYSFTADAEILVQTRLKGSKSATVSIRGGSPQDQNNNTNQVWDDKENIEGEEEEAKLLSGMASHLGDMRVDTEGGTNSDIPRNYQVNDNIGNRPDEYGLWEMKRPIQGDGEYYIVSPEEAEMILERIESHISSHTPMLCNIPGIDVLRKIILTPTTCLEDNSIDPAWVTAGFCLAYFALGFNACVTDTVRYRKELVLKMFMARNAWSSFKDLRIFLTPGLVHVQALMMMCIIAQDTSRPGLCWMLLCQACRLAQAMGLHRRVDPLASSGLTPHDIKLRSSLFWMLYILDMSFSLSFGRTPCFQDYDCDVELPPITTAIPDKDMSPSSVLACFEPNYFRAMVELARLQSQVYKKLYSARGSGNGKGKNRLGMKETEKWVWELDARLRVLKESPVYSIATMAFHSWLPEGSPHYEDIVISTKSLEFTYHTLMTMIHRRLFNPTPMQEYGDESVESMGITDSRRRSRNILLLSARSAIQIVKKLGENHKNYVKTKWLILFHPFAPFFVLFSKIVTSPNSPTNDIDFQLMCYVVNFLKDMRSAAHIDDFPSVNNEQDGIKKLLTVVNAFIRVARSFIRRDKERLRKSLKEQQGSDSNNVQGGQAPYGTPKHTPPVYPSCSMPIGPPGHGPMTPQEIYTPNSSTNATSASGPNSVPSQYNLQSNDTFTNFQQPSINTTFSPNNPHIDLTTQDESQNGFVRWNTSVPSMLSMNQLQDLASMELDVNMDPTVMAPSPYDGYSPQYPGGYTGDRGAQGGSMEQSGQGAAYSGMNMDYRQQTADCNGKGKMEGNFMEMFESGVRQGAMDFDWINWEA